MGKYTFTPIGKEINRWHPELGEGDNLTNYFENVWFDAPLNGPDGLYYIRVSPFPSTVLGSHGAKKGGLPAMGFDLLLPNGVCIDEYKFYDPEEFIPLEPYGCKMGPNTYSGTLNEKGQVETIEFDVVCKGVGIHLKGKTIAQGLKFVEADHGYSYYHPIKKTALGWWPIAPRLEVEGMLTIEGKEIPVKGPGYLDAQLGNLPKPFGGSGQQWWTWGHFWAGEYTATFTESAAGADKNYFHFSPFMLWKNSELLIATHDFTNYVEQFAIDEASGKFYPKVLSVKAADGSVRVTAQITNGVLVEPTTTSLTETSKYARQFADVEMQISRFGGINDESEGKCVIEFGGGMHYLPWDRIFNNKG